MIRPKLWHYLFHRRTPWNVSLMLVGHNSSLPFPNVAQCYYMLVGIGKGQQPILIHTHALRAFIMSDRNIRVPNINWTILWRDVVIQRISISIPSYVCTRWHVEHHFRVVEKRIKYKYASDGGQSKRLTENNMHSARYKRITIHSVFSPMKNSLSPMKSHETEYSLRFDGFFLHFSSAVFFFSVETDWKDQLKCSSATHLIFTIETDTHFIPYTFINISGSMWWWELYETRST